MSGRHCTLDGWALAPDGNVPAAAAAALDDPALLAEVLDTLVGMVGMEILKPAELLTVPLDPDRVEGDEDCGGVTGVVILTTSHASVHTWPLRGQVSFDLYSCRDFDEQVVFAFLRERLGLSGGTLRSFPRGHDPAHRFAFVRADQAPSRRYFDGEHPAQRSKALRNPRSDAKPRASAT